MFSVVIPTYNSEKTIKTTIDSIINQTRADLIEEIIIVDDGSIDNTVNLLNEIKSSCKINIVIIKQKNSGPSKARNVGIKSAKGEWIALLDSDDKWTLDKIEKQAEIINNNNNIYFLGSQKPLKILFKEHKGLVKLSPQDVCIRSMPNCSSVVFTKKTAKQFGLFKENMKYGEDANFFQNYFKLDSYYILAENLTILDTGKSFKGQSGLSSNYKGMYEGKKKNMREMRDSGWISTPYLVLMYFFCDLKLIRQEVIRIVNRIKNHE